MEAGDSWKSKYCHQSSPFPSYNSSFEIFIFTLTINMTKSYEIVILGAHHAGITAAHFLLKKVIPALSKLTPETVYHVTVIDPNTEFFYNVPSPRTAANDAGAPVSKIFLPISEGFKAYTPENFTFVLGKATSISPDTKSVTVRLAESETDKNFTYNSLVVATGSKSTSNLWFTDNTGATKTAYINLQDSLKAADTVLIAGGGAVGVETAAEIGFYLKKKITLLSGGERLLVRHPLGNSSSAESKLKALGVETIHNLRVTGSKVAGSKTEVILSDGTTRIADVYIDATGPTPNNSFLPPAWLDSSGKIAVEEDTFRIKGVQNVYAAGDIASNSDGGIMNPVMFGTATLGSAIAVDIAKEMGVKSPLPLKAYKPMKNSQFVTIGPNGGVGQMMGWRLPSFAVWLAKSRTMFVENAEPTLTGSSI